MALSRSLRGSGALLVRTFYVGETPTDATGDVTVTVTRLDGTAVSSGTAVHPGAPGVYTYTLPAQDDLDLFEVTWSGTVGGVVRTYADQHEVVGGFLFEVPEARALPPALDTTRFPTATIEAVRTVVEVECERICGQAFVPRFKREAVRIINHSVLPTEAHVRAIRSVTIAGTPYTGWVWPKKNGAIMDVYQATWDNEEAVIEYEYGLDAPPEDIRRAAMLRLRSQLTASDNGIPSRAVSFTVTDGGVYRLATPGEDRTGHPDVDAVYHSNKIDVWGFA